MPQPNWISLSGTIGTYSSSTYMSYQLLASPVNPATTLTFQLLSGSLPNGLFLNNIGQVNGTTPTVYINTTSTFVVRATDNLGNISDRSFSITISGIDAPYFTTPPGTILSTLDSIWTELPIQFENPVENSEVFITLAQGQLPPGLEINDQGLIRGYPDKPTMNINAGNVVTFSVATNDNAISCYSTAGFFAGRPVKFSGTAFGGINTSQVYYIKEVIDRTTFTISYTEGGSQIELTDAIGYMTTTLPDIVIGQPTIRSYDFTLRLNSDYGNSLRTFRITVTNQNTPNSSGGPGYPPNTRVPVLTNTKPRSYNLDSDPTIFRYYLLPEGNAFTYDNSFYAPVGTFNSGNDFSFKALGYDFDGNLLEYTFNDLPLGLTGNPDTGWINGPLNTSPNTINKFVFSVSVHKKLKPELSSETFNFEFIVQHGIDGTVTWTTPEQVGTINNGSLSNLFVEASADVDLTYILTSGSLPPNLTLLSTGELSGVVSYEPNIVKTEPGRTTSYEFEVTAYSPTFPVISSTKKFKMNVFQKFSSPHDSVRIKCAPSFKDRKLLKMLLNSDSIIPPDCLYRRNDPFYAKARSIHYTFSYGISASSFEEYLATTTINHYWRNVTLGDIKYAVARNDQDEIIYEVVYSEVVDNLINPAGVSVRKELAWPTRIQTDKVDTTVVYPNSLPNMRKQLSDVLGENLDPARLPLWMTSRQPDNTTIGYIPAWVICYAKPGCGQMILDSIKDNWTTKSGKSHKLNEINFQMDRYTVYKGLTYNYDNELDPAVWTSFPGGTPAPNPIDSEDFFVIYPRQKIIPT